jgi:hypothetical protein
MEYNKSRLQVSIPNGSPAAEECTGSLREIVALEHKETKDSYMPQVLQFEG